MINFEDSKKELINWFLWMHYEKQEMNHEEYLFLLKELSNDIDLEGEMREIIINYAEFYRNK